MVTFGAFVFNAVDTILWEVGKGIDVSRSSLDSRLDFRGFCPDASLEIDFLLKGHRT